MKKIISLLLTLSMAASAGAGLAEENYIPGKITQELTQNALAEGRHISVSLSGIFEPGSTMIDDAEGQAALEAVGRLLECSALRFGYAATQEGPRFEFGGYVYDDDGSVVSSDNAVTLTKDGIVFVTDLLEDRKITVSWETLLTAADVDEDTMNTFLALRDTDWAALGEQAGAFLNEFSGLAISAAAPYVNVLVSWAAALPAETVDHAANALVPETPGMTQVRVSESHLLILADRLAEVLSKDETLLPVLDAMLAYAGVTDTDAAGLISEVRSTLVSAEVDDFSLVLTYTADAELPFVFNADLMTGSAEPAADFLLMIQPGENSADQVTLRASAGQGDGACALSADGTVTLDPANALVFDYSFTVGASVNGEPKLSAALSNSSVSFTAESGQPGYRMNRTGSMNIPGYIKKDEETYDISTKIDTEKSAEWVRTEEGGESCTVHTTYDVTESGDVATDTICDSYYAIEPTEDGLFDAYYSKIFSLPDTGIESIGFSMTVFGDQYEDFQSQLTPVVLESLTGDDMDALINELGTAARARRDALINILPLELQDSAKSILCGGFTEAEAANSEAAEDWETESDMPAGDSGDYLSGYTTGYDSGFSAGFQAALSLYGIDTGSFSEGFEDVPEQLTGDAEQEETFGGTVIENPEDTGLEAAVD